MIVSRVGVGGGAGAVAVSPVREGLATDAIAAATGVARRGRRRTNSAVGARAVRNVQIKLNEVEARLVEQLEAEQGVTAQVLFVRSLLTGGAEAAAEYERLRDELSAARRLLAAVSANVNQLARQANAAGGGVDVQPVTAEQLAVALRALARSVEGIDAVTARAGGGALRRAAAAGPAAASAIGAGEASSQEAAMAAGGAGAGAGRRARAGGAR